MAMPCMFTSIFLYEEATIITYAWSLELDYMVTSPVELIQGILIHHIVISGQSIIFDQFYGNNNMYAG